MPLAQFPNSPAPAQDFVQTPPHFPEVPDEILQRFESAKTWNGDIIQWYKALVGAIGDQQDSVTSVVNANDQTLGTVVVQQGEMTAEIETIQQTIINNYGVLAQRIVTVSALAGSSSHITVQNAPPGGPAVNDLWVDNSVPQTPVTYKWNGAAWIEVTEPISVAAVAAEQTARITADGFLEGKYTLTVIAGNVVTGMNITSSTGGGTNVSSVIFRATDFQIYNGVIGKTMFSVSGTDVQLAGVLTVSTSGKVFIGTGTYANSNTAWYVDSAGQFSLKDKLTWDGTTLSVTGNVVITSGTNYAGSPSVGGAANTIVGQAATATNSDFAVVTGATKPENNATLGAGWGTNLTGRPTELTDGRITTAISAAGLVISGVKPGINVTTGSAGLYLGSDFMGYYNGSAWKTYMDSSGNFYLGGTSGALQWNGTTLSVTGAITATTGTIGGWTINSTTLSKNSATLDSAGQLILGTANNVVYLSATDATYRLWVGNVTAGSAAFSVTKAGVLTATGATIDGTLTSTSGTIAGFTLNATGFTTGSGASFVQIQSTGATIQFGSGGNQIAVYSAQGLVITNTAGVGTLAAFLGTTGGNNYLRIYNNASTLIFQVDATSAVLSLAGIIKVANGSVGAPAYSFSGATGDGWWSNGSGDMRASTSGSLRFVIRDSAVVLLVPLKFDTSQQAITTETLQNFITATDASGATIKLGIVA